MTNLVTIDPSELQQKLDNAVLALESGKVLFFKLPFDLSEDEVQFLTPDIVDPRSKNISYDIRGDSLRGTICEGEKGDILKAMLRRYAHFSRRLVEKMYSHHLTQARTSFRPVEAEGRATSAHKDDTRLHVDAFPANPVSGKRILRVFTNVNPSGKPRVWRIGEPFADVAASFIPTLGAPLPGLARLLKALKITKTLRSPYDHYMLKLHDAMKTDLEYQKAAPKEEVLFPPGSTWIVFTDQVSHAAMSGQHMFEQSFYLPPEALKHPERSPLRILESLLQKKLI